MKPTIEIIEDNLIKQVLDEAKQILAEVGVEVMGQALRERLLDYGLKQDPASQRHRVEVRSHCPSPGASTQPE